MNDPIDQINPICLNAFTIKSRSAQMHLKNIGLHGQIFLSCAHDACDVSVPIANSKWPIIGTEVLRDIMT